jgi:hypothetical protein
MFILIYQHIDFQFYGFPFFYSSCFNAFSRVDVRVEVKIPGGVDSYIVDLRGEKYVPICTYKLSNILISYR